MKDKSFYGFLAENAKEYGDNIAVLYDTFAVSYRTLFEDVVKKAIHLARFDGKRIAIYGPASYRWIVNMFGSIVAGKDVVLVDFFIPREERVRILDKVHADYILCSTNQYILSDAEASIIPNADKDDVTGLSYDENTVEGNVIILTAAADECNKPVTLSVENILAAVSLINNKCSCGSEDKVLSQVSLSQIFGLVYSLIWPLYCGACVCVGRGLRHIDADTYYYDPTILPVNPSMADYLKKIKAFNNSLKRIIVGEAMCKCKLFDSLKNRKFEVQTIYGTAETSGCIGVGNEDDGVFEFFDKDAVKLADDGEILVTGSCISKNSGGVVHTGDYGRLVGEGKLLIERPNEDIIVLPTGERICRRIVNREISALNGVAEGYVTFVGDKLTAVIVPINKEERKEMFKRRVDKYNEKKGYRWEIQRIVTLDSPLPRKDDGSVDREELEKMELVG